MSIRTTARVVFTALALAYSLQLGSPLRMFNDSIAYVAMAESAVDGQGFRVPGISEHWPVGYPFVLAALMVLGVAGPVGFVALNLVFLVLGLFATYAVLTRGYALPAASAIRVCALCLLAYGFAKYAGAVVSDIVFFGLSVGTLAVLVEAERAREGRRRVGWIALAIALAAACIAVRIVGIALLPAIAWVAFRHSRWFAALASQHVRDRSAGSIFGIACVGLIAGGVGLWLIMQTEYFRLISQRFEGVALVDAASYLVKRRLLEQGRMWLNLREELYPDEYTFVFPVLLGAVVWLVLARGAWERRKRFAVVDVFTFGFVGLHLFHPFFLERHWLPILPFLLVVAAEGVRGFLHEPAARGLIAAYSAWFVVTGVAALILTVRLSLSGSEFPSHFRPNRETYQVAFGSDAKPAPELVKPRLLDQLRRYEPLAAAATHRPGQR